MSSNDPAAALQQFEGKYRQLLDSVSDAVIQLDEHGRITLANQAAQTTFGYSAEELAGRDIKWLLPDFQRTAPPGSDLASTAGVHKSGSEIFLQLTVRSQTPGDLLVVCRDVTERKSLDQQLRQSQRLETLGRLAGGVAHDFNNLLTIITGHSEFLLNHLGPKHRLRGLVKEVKKAADRAAALTRQLLAFSRRQALEPQQVDLNAVVGSMEKMLRRVIGEDVELKTVLQFGLGEVKADPAQLEQILLNLAVNARDAMPQGGKLTIETRQVELTDDSRPASLALGSGRYVVLSVSDTGTAIDPAAQQHLFDPLPPSGESNGRSGLGLASLYEIVEQNGGQVTVSTDGSGTRFDVYLPLSEEGAELIDLSKAREGLKPGSETVLLVEDEEAVRRVLHAALARRGYNVLDAHDGHSALDVAAAHDGAIDLLVTDVIMPRMSGRELANHLAANHKEMRLLFISGYADDTVLQHDVLGSEVSFMQKPFTPDALARKVRAVLDAGAARASAEPRPKHAPGTAPPPLTFPAARGRE